MKIPSSTAPVLIAIGAGFAGGWLCKPQPTTHSSDAGKTSTASLSGTKLASMAGSSGSSKDSTSASAKIEGSIESHFGTELQSLKRLSDAEFASRMTDVWFARESPENHLSRALFASACDSGKAIAFYEEFKRRKGVASNEDAGQVLWDFLSSAGKRYGAELVQKLTESNPEGILEIETIVHGWVNVEPMKAVAWLNSLPEDCPYYSKSLKGIVWGIGETHPASAAEMFLKLPADERNQKFESLGGGAISGHGIAGLNEIVARLPDEQDRANLLMASMSHAMGKPPADFINGMAGHLSAVPDLTGPFQIMAGRWVKSSPNDAITWLDKNAGTADQSVALRVMASQLSREGHADALDAWLTAHPESPGVPSVLAGLLSGKEMRQ